MKTKGQFGTIAVTTAQMILRTKTASAAILIIVVAVLAALAWAVARNTQDRPTNYTPPSPATMQTTLPRLLSMNAGELEQVSIEWMNLMCATGLPGSDLADAGTASAALDRMARQVKTETERHHHKFQTNPEEFNHSEAYYRMLCLVTVLQQDFSVRYSPNRARPSDGPIEPNDTFFADSRDIFLHGLLGPERTGTCASMPVLYVAVGRKLGYPLKLVATKNHLFVRWEDSRERLNIEATSHGLTTFDDDYYRRWPFPMSPEEERSERYLVSLSAAEEFAVFLSLRTQCLLAAGRHKEALECQEHACRMAPASPNQRRLLNLAKLD